MNRSALLLLTLALFGIGCRPDPSDTDTSDKPEKPATTTNDKRSETASTDKPAKSRPKARPEKPGTILGKWVVISSEVEGRPSPKDADRYIRMTFSGEDATLQARTRKHELRFVLDTSKQPNEIILYSKQEKVRWLGIYQVKGNLLHLSYGQPNGERPTNLNTSQGAKAILYVLKREGS